MKLYSKICVLFSVIVMSILSCTSVKALAKEADDSGYDTFYYEEDILNAWGTFTDEEREDYAGVYVDGDTVVLLFKEDTDTLINAITRNENNKHRLIDNEKKLQQPLKVKSANYSYDDLMKIDDYLIKNAYSVKGVYSIGTDYKGNCLDIGVLWDASVSDVKETLFDMIKENTDVEIVSDSLLNFHTVKEDDLITYKISVDGNSELITGTKHYSAAVGHYSSTYGLGFITTGHGPSVGDPVKLGLITVGYVSAVNHNGIDDSAFVTFAGSPGTHWWTSITTQNEAKASVSPAQGVTIRVRGYQTTQYANAIITDNNFSYYNNQDNIYWSDMLKVDYPVQDGDSGGAAYWWTTNQNATTKVIGVISAGASTFTVIVKSSNINY